MLNKNKSAKMETIYIWLENHGSICPWVASLCTLLTFLFTFVFKKKKKEKTRKQNITNVHNSKINQAGGNIIIKNNVR